MAVYRRHFATSAEAELQEAARLMQHRFTFLGHTVAHGPGIDWSQDPAGGKSWGMDYSPDIVYRGSGRLGDIKLAWEINKHQYFFTLGKAAWLSGNEEYAREIIRQICSWIEQNPCMRGIHWVSALETGTRAVSWILAWPFYAAFLEPAERKRILASMAQHMRFVERNLSTGQFPNTHLVGEAAVLVAGGLFLRNRRSARWLAAGMAHLVRELRRQLRSDGGHVEQSVSYHRFFLDQYYLAEALLRANGMSLGPEALAGIERATTWLRDMLFPDGSAPAFCDGDDARGLWFRSDCPADYRSLLALGSLLFDRADLRYCAQAPCEEALWLFGVPGFERLLRLPCRPPEHASCGHTGTGYYVLRSGWNPGDQMLVVDCGPLGWGPAGHGHADALSFQLYADGHAFLVDPGTYSYNLDYGWRDAFRSTAAHNTITVDDLDQSVMKDRMAWSVQANATCLCWIPAGSLTYFEGEHDGYRRLSDPVTHRRAIARFADGLWVILDTLTARGEHEAGWWLHVAPDCAVIAGEDPGAFRLHSPSGAELSVLQLPPGDVEDPAGAECGTPLELGEAWFSPGYGLKQLAPLLGARRRFHGTGRFITCLSTSSGNLPRVEVRDGGVIVELERDDARHTLVWRGDPGPVRGAGPRARTDAGMLYLREMRGKVDCVVAARLRELHVPGMVDLTCDGVIDSVVIEDGCCRISASGEVRPDVADAGLTVFVNGSPAPARVGRGATSHRA